MNNNLGRNLRRLGKLSAADTVDRALRRSCIGRIVNLLTLVFILGCLGVWLVLFFLANQTGLADRFSGTASTVLGIAFFGGLLVALILAGLIGNWIRKRIWRSLLTRRKR